jgi:hypothetical protein
MKEMQRSMDSSPEYSLVRKPVYPPFGEKHYDVMTPSDFPIAIQLMKSFAESIRKPGAIKK